MPTTTATNPPDRPVALPVDDLAKAVLRALEVGNKPYELGCEIKEELPQRLRRDGVQYQSEDLSLALVKLEDSGCLVRFQRQMQPQRITGNGSKYYDDIDRLAADIGALIKEHDEEFSSEQELQSWLAAVGIEHDVRAFVMALRQLEELGRVRRPRQDHWRDDLPLPGTWVPPRVHPLNG
jgi:hypothetical protein